MDKNQGYTILRAAMLENGRGFALGEHPTAPSRYVTWACYDDEHGQRQYEWGHYGNDLNAMEQDFKHRLMEYQRLYKVQIVQVEAPGLYKYYSTQRPVDIGTYPRPKDNLPVAHLNYGERQPVEGESFRSWGELWYRHPLTEQQMSDYELRPARDNPEGCQTVPDRGHARKAPIKEQIKEARRLASEKREHPAYKKTAPDRGDR